MIDGYIPGRKAFEVHELRRIPVRITDDAREEIALSSAEGRKFPQALAEYFGGYQSIKEVHVHAVARSAYFESLPEHFHPITGRESRILEIDIIHSDDRIQPHCFLINADDLHWVSKGDPNGFRAHTAAAELVRMTPAHFKEAG